MVDKISSLDPGYTAGDLSSFPIAYDTKSDLYIATNNAETTLKQALSYGGTKIIVESSDDFPDKGILRIGTLAGEPGSNELIYYETKTSYGFTDLKRGYCGTRQNRWPAACPVTSGVMAEHFNALRDAVINIEENLGIKTAPATGSLNDLLIQLEQKWLSPRALFRAAPKLIGPPPLTVRFQNFCLAHTIRYLWDFGDGTTSTERSPTHTYYNDGEYSVRLDVITDLGGTSIQTKTGYIIVDSVQITPFIYVEADPKTPGNISIETALAEGLEPTKFYFVDQSDGEISQRFWVFGDGESEEVDDPNNHVTTHYFTSPGEYSPSILVVFKNSVYKRGFAEDSIIVR